MTVTESYEEMKAVYLKNGWITPKQVKRIERSSLAMALGIVLLPIALGALFFIWRMSQ